MQRSVFKNILACFQHRIAVLIEATFNCQNRIGSLYKHRQSSNFGYNYWKHDFCLCWISSTNWCEDSWSTCEVLKYPFAQFTLKRMSWPVNISEFKFVHHGHFGTMQRFLGFTVKFWCSWEVDGPLQGGIKYFASWQRAVFIKNFGLKSLNHGVLNGP